MIPATVKVPAVPKEAVDFTLRTPPPRLCEPPSTAVACPATAASFVMSTRLIETPTPMPSLDPVPTVSPLAAASEIVAARVLALAVPPEVIVMPPTNSAFETVVMMLIATAAATWTEVLPLPPSLSPVEAFGVSVVDAFLPVLSLRSLLALVSCSSDLPLTSLVDVSSVLVFAPFALASASLSLSDEPLAARLTASPALMFRVTVAVTVSLTIARASARPIETSAPPALAFAVVVVLGF